MDGHLDDHRGTVLVDGAGHWVQQERPDEVNAALLDFLAGYWRWVMRSAVLRDGQMHVRDDVDEPRPGPGQAARRRQGVRDLRLRPPLRRTTGRRCSTLGSRMEGTPDLGGARRRT